MATLKLIENGIKKAVNGKRRKRRGRRRNPATTTATAKRVTRRNPTTKTQAASYAKKNGFKLVSKTVANGKRKRRGRKRNGVTAIAKRSNGLFGTGTAIVKKTLTLTGGAVATNIGGNWIASLVSQYLAQFGLGQYTNLITQALVAQFGVPYLARMLKQDPEMAKLGGFLSVTLTALNQFFPQFSSLNPFTSNAIVVNPNGQVALTGNAAAALVQAAQADTAAKVGGFLSQMNGGSAGSGWVNSNYINSDVNAVM